MFLEERMQNVLAFLWLVYNNFIKRLLRTRGAYLNTINVFQVTVKSIEMTSPDSLGKITLEFLYHSVNETGIIMRSPLDV
jgi:hypothetical protein